MGDGGLVPPANFLDGKRGVVADRAGNDFLWVKDFAALRAGTCEDISGVFYRQGRNRD